jgi:hypothetical protein
MSWQQNIHIEFKPTGRGAAQCEADPNHPDGIEIDMSKPHKPSCLVVLPYPAPECGLWMIRCGVCAKSLIVTAAGRRDDATSVRMACAERPN